MAPKRKKKKTANNQRTKIKAIKVSSKNKKSVKENNTMQDEIYLIIALVVSVLLFLSNFNLVGMFGRVVSGIIFGLIGVEAYILPVIIFFITAFYISNKGNRRAGRKILSAFVFLIALASLIELLTQMEALSTYNILEYYNASSESHLGGGLIGGIFGKLLLELFGKVGSYIILIALMLISVIVITGKAILIYIAGKSNVAIREHIRQQKRRRHTDYSAEDADEDYIDVKMERPRRVAKTFVIESTAPVTLAASNKTTKDKPNDEADNKSNGYNLADFMKQDDKAISYEDELREKFGDTFDELPAIENIDNAFEAAFDNTLDESMQTEPLEKELNSIELEPVLIEHESLSDKADNTLDSQVSSNADNINQTKIEVIKGDELTISESTQEKEYVFPPISLLTEPKNKAGKAAATDRILKETAMKLQSTLESFGVHVTVTNASIGPAVTRYELQPEQGVRVNEITRLADDIKLNLAASEIRIEAPIPGKAAVGIEVPNKENTMVTLRELIESREFNEHPSKIAFAVGKDIGGQPVVADIAKMPHLLIAGATGSGKSVCINTLIMSILYKASPADVKLIMVDPKVVELSMYNGIPHLLIPVVTDPKKASAALNWAVAEMTERYKKFADFSVKDIKSYNEKVAEVAHLNDENFQKMPQIVIIIDELADLMMVAQHEVEDAICRLAQLARAAGIHLVIATQRPSVNVITGLIKANIPSRIAFAVSSQVDSKTILDGAGAEKLLGKGDMLFFPSGLPKPIRVQGCFVNDKEVNAVVDFLKNNTEAKYNEEIHEKISNAKAGDSFTGGTADRDEYFAEAGRFIIEKDKASIGMLQRVYKIGFNRAARIMDQLAEAGVVGPEEGTKPRKVLMTLEQFEQYLEEN